MKRARLVLVTSQVLLLSVAACGAFSGTNAVDDVAEPQDGSFDSTISDSTAPDTSVFLTDSGEAGGGGSTACNTSDASTYTVPLGTMTCGGVAGIDTAGDLDNCGACGHRCDVQCTFGLCQPTVLVPYATDLLSLIGVDGTRVYYARFASSSTFIYAASKTMATTFGNALSTTIADVGGVLDASANTRVLYGPATLGNKLYGHLQRDNFSVDLNGSNLRGFPPNLGGNIIAAPPYVYGVDDKSVYQFFEDGGATGPGGTQLFQTGSAIWDMAATPGGAWFFWIDRAGGGNSGLDSAAPQNGLLRRMSAAWNDPKTLYELPVQTNNQGGSSVLAATKDFVFFAEANTGDLLRLPVNVIPGSGVKPTRVWTANGRSILQLLPINDRIYFISVAPTGFITTDVRSISVCGGLESIHVGATYHVNGLSTDGTYLYWADGDGIKRTVL